MGNDISSDKNPAGKTQLKRSISLKMKRPEGLMSPGRPSGRKIQRSSSFTTKNSHHISKCKIEPDVTKFNDYVYWTDLKERLNSIKGLKDTMQNDSDKGETSIQEQQKAQAYRVKRRNNTEIYANKRFQEALDKMVADELSKRRPSDDCEKGTYSVGSEEGSDEEFHKEASSSEGEVVERFDGEMQGEKKSTRRKKTKCKKARSHSVHCFSVNEDGTNQEEEDRLKRGKPRRNRRNSDTTLLKLEHIKRSQQFSEMLKKYQESHQKRRLSPFTASKLIEDIRKPKFYRSCTFFDNWIQQQKDRLDTLSQAAKGDADHFNKLWTLRKDVLELPFKVSLPQRPNTVQLPRREKPLNVIIDSDSDDDVYLVASRCNSVPTKETRSVLESKPKDVTRFQPILHKLPILSLNNIPVVIPIP